MHAGNQGQDLTEARCARLPQQSYLANCHPNVVLYGSKVMKGLQVHTNLKRIVLHVDKSNDVALYEQQEISGEAMAGIIKERKDSLGYAARCTRSMQLLLGSSLAALLLQRSICTAFRCTTFLLSQHPVYLLLSLSHVHGIPATGFACSVDLRTKGRHPPEEQLCVPCRHCSGVQTFKESRSKEGLHAQNALAAQLCQQSYLHQL